MPAPSEVVPLGANNSSYYPNTTGPIEDEGGTGLVTGPQRGATEVLTIAALLTTIVVVTVGGNLLVIATVWTNRKMHNITNYFLVSLATTDLLLGCVVLPLSVVNTLSPYWPFGPVFCNIYISCDVMLCTVSILTLFVISLDRYFAVTTPLRYQGRMTSRIVWRVSAAIWIFSLVMAFLPIHFGWNSPDGSVQNTRQPDVCALALNGPYVLLISLGTYFTPLIVMSAVYVRVLQITRMQVKEINKLGRLSMTPSKTKHEHQVGRLRKWLERSPPKDHHHQLHKQQQQQQHPHSRCSTDHPPSSHNAAIVSDRKAIVNLASIVLAFAICWVPYFVLFTLKPFVDLPLSSGFGYHFDLFALWLGYANSSINPFLYAFYNSSFRNGFRRLLCSRCGRNRSNAALGLRSFESDWDGPRGAAAAGNGKGPDYRTRGSVEDRCGNGLGLRVGLCSTASVKGCDGLGGGDEGAETSSTRSDSSRTEVQNLKQTTSNSHRFAFAKGVERSRRDVENSERDEEGRRTSGGEKSLEVPCKTYISLTRRCFETNRQQQQQRKGQQRNFITTTQRTNWNLSSSFDSKAASVV